MPRYIKTQTAFLGGEQSPFLGGRTDIEQYRYGCELLRNATILPQGGWIRRAGTKLLDKLSSSTSNKAFKLVGFTKDFNTRYLLIFEAGKLSIYRNGVETQAISNSDFTESSIDLIDTAQLADTMIITHQSFQSKELRWKGGDDKWEMKDIKFDVIPDYFFNDEDSPPGSEDIQELYLEDTGVGSVFKLALGGFETAEIAVQDGDWQLTGDRIEEELLALSITPASGITVVQDGYVPPSGSISTMGLGDGGTDPGDGGGTEPEPEPEPPSGHTNLKFIITFKDKAADNWPAITGSFVYRSDRPDEYVYSTKIKEGDNRKEPVWSDSRGWPKICAFFENRLVMAATRMLPQNLWCSRLGEYYDFNEGDGLESDAINRTIATNINNEIINIASSRELQVLTSNGEHYNPYAMTPAAFGMPSQTTNGSKAVRPQVINGATYFIQRRGNGVRQFVYTDSENAYNTSNVALLSEHLIQDVVDTAKTQGIQTDADYLYCLNANGTIAVMNVIRGQNILAWSLWETNAGKFHAIGNVEEDLYCVMLCDDGYYLCMFDEDIAMDMAQTFSDKQVVSLANKGAYTQRVDAVTDWMHAGDFDPSQSIDLRNTYDDIEVGVNFMPRCIPNAVADEITNGSNKNKKKRPVRAWVEMVNAIGIDLVYNDKVRVLAYRELPLSFADPAPEPFTGTKEQRLTGYSKQTTFEIRQTLPFKKAAVLSLQVEIKTV